MKQLHFHNSFDSSSLSMFCTNLKLGSKKEEIPNSFHHYTLRKESPRNSIFHFALLLENAISALATYSHIFTTI